MVATLCPGRKQYLSTLCRFTGRLPNGDWGKGNVFTRLRKLLLANNDFNGPLPYWNLRGAWHALEELDVSNNLFYGGCPGTRQPPPCQCAMVQAPLCPPLSFVARLLLTVLPPLSQHKQSTLCMSVLLQHAPLNCIAVRHMISIEASMHRLCKRKRSRPRTLTSLLLQGGCQ